MTQLVIIRGLPGSGKSTEAKKEFPHHKHVEADMYFVDRKTGEYKFDFTKLNAAHKWCQKTVFDALRGDHDVVVTNTFTQTWEFDPYITMIQELSFEHNVEIDLLVVEMKTQYTNIHGVPEDKMQKMRDRWHSWETVKEDLGLADDEVTYQEVV